MRICEKNSEVFYEVTMRYREENGNWTPDCASDILDYLTFDHDKDAYIVDSVEDISDWIDEWNAYETEWDTDEEAVEEEKRRWGERIGHVVKCD